MRPYFTGIDESHGKDTYTACDRMRLILTAPELPLVTCRRESRVRSGLPTPGGGLWTANSGYSASRNGRLEAVPRYGSRSVPSEKDSTRQANSLVPAVGSSAPAWFEVPAGVFMRPKHEVKDDLNAVRRAFVWAARYSGYRGP